MANAQIDVQLQALDQHRGTYLGDLIHILSGKHAHGVRNSQRAFSAAAATGISLQIIAQMIISNKPRGLTAAAVHLLSPILP